MQDPGWRVERLRAGAAELHATTTDFGERVMRVNEVARPALVLGSAQRRSMLDEAAVTRFGFEVVKRHSGGGLVHLRPGTQLWIDFFMPADDPLWNDDVSHSTDWLGAVWVAALGSLGWKDLQVVRGAWSDPELGRIACFAANGPGEVLVGGRKLVGISQRRTRHGARFQCTTYLDFDPTPLEESLKPDAIGNVELRTRLSEVLGSHVASLGEQQLGLPAQTERGRERSTIETVLNAVVERLP